MIVIYSTPNCKYCREAKEHFDSEGIEYAEINVAEDKDARAEMIELSGQMGVPVIRIDDDVFVGWNEDHRDEIDALLA